MKPINILFLIMSVVVVTYGYLTYLALESVTALYQTSYEKTAKALEEIEGKRITDKDGSVYTVWIPK